MPKQKCDIRLDQDAEFMIETKCGHDVYLCQLEFLSLMRNSIVGNINIDVTRAEIMEVLGKTNPPPTCDLPEYDPNEKG